MLALEERVYSQYLAVATLVVLTISGASGGSVSPVLVPANVTVGRSLEAPATVTLSSPAPEGGLQVTLTSGDPSRLVLSRSADAAGSASITIPVRAGSGSTPEFYVQGLADRGTVTYTASAPGSGSVEGKVTLAASAIAIAGPGGVGAGDATLQTTVRSRKWRITVLNARGPQRSGFSGSRGRLGYQGQRDELQSGGGNDLHFAGDHRPGDKPRYHGVSAPGSREDNVVTGGASGVQ